MKKLIAKLLTTMLALLITAAVIPGIIVTGIWPAFWAALILGIVNIIIKPLFTILTLPLTILTLGLFLFVINGIMLMITAWFVTGFAVSGLLAAILGSILLSLVSGFFYDLVE